MLKGYLRSPSAARILYSKNNDVKLTEETKDKIRKSRLKYLKENPEKTAWRTKNMSFPEKIFNDQIKERQIDQKYFIVRELCIFPYYIDFAFINEKVAVEIDGSQHLKEDRKEKDLKKDELLKEKGWRVIRITAKEMQTNTNETINKILTFVKSDKKYEKIGLLEYDQYKRDYIIKEKNKINEHKRKQKIKIEFERIEKIKNLILNSDIDFLKRGWVNKVSKIIGITTQKVNSWMKRNMLDFYNEKCLKRKKNILKITRECLKCKNIFLTHTNTFCSRYCAKSYNASNINKNKITAIDKNGKYICVDKNDDRLKNGELHHMHKNTCFIYNIELKQNKRIRKEELEKYLKLGWIKGRKLKF